MHDGTPLLPPIAIAGKSFKSNETPKPAQCKAAELIINNIKHTIGLVTKPKLDYILTQNNSLPEQRHGLITKYNICTFTALLMTP